MERNVYNLIFSIRRKRVRAEGGEREKKRERQRKNAIKSILKIYLGPR